MMIEPTSESSEKSSEPSGCVKLSSQTASDTLASGDDKAPTLLQVMMSVLAAFGGVQNKENKERDFKHGNFKVFVIVAASFTFLFLLGIFAVVQLVLK